MIDVTVIMPTLIRTEEYANVTIDSLLANTKKFNPIVMKMYNGEGTGEIPGQCRAVNKAIPDVETEWIMIINDDFYFAPGWDNNIEWSHDCFCPNWIEPMEVGSAPPFRKLDAGETLETFNQKLVDDFVRDNEESEIENGFNLGLFVKTDLFKRIGGYDESYDPYGSNSDSDLQYALESAGVQPKRNRGMLIYHFGSKSEDGNPDKQKYWQKNWDYFISKWGFVREESPDIWNHNLHVPLKKLKFKPDWSIYANPNDR